MRPVSGAAPESALGGGKPQKGAKQVIPFGKYLLLDRISVGGMAEVYRSKAFGVEGFERIIAIKRILPTMAEDEEFIEMFIDEAKIVGQLSHANIVPIYELGKIGDSHFIAMEFVWGKDLLQIMNRHRRIRQYMPAPMAAWIASRICEGLDYAHRKKDSTGTPLEIIHRDVSPQNVLVSYEGEVKLIDFGIAKAAHRQTRTQAGVLKGKFGYMSPEQVRGLPLDRRSDVFAVGTCLYEMLTSERLFLGESDFSTLEKVRNADVEPPSKHNAAIPREVEDIILKALSRDPEDRFQWASEMQEALQRYLLTVKPIFNAQKLAQFMKTTFSAERKAEKEKMEDQQRIGRDRLSGSLPPPPPVDAIAAAPAHVAAARAAAAAPSLPRDWESKTPLLEEDPAVEVDDMSIEIDDESLHSAATQIGASLSDSLSGGEIAAQPTTIFFSNEEALLQSASPLGANVEPAEIPSAPTVILPDELRPIEEVVRGTPVTRAPDMGEYPSADGAMPEMPSAIPAPAPAGTGWKIAVLFLALVSVGLGTVLALNRFGSPGLVGLGPAGRATIVVAARPTPEADVLVDGTARGRTPLKIEGLEPGPHQVAVMAPGYRPWEGTVTVTAGAVELVVGILEPAAAAQGILHLQLATPGSRVAVDGVEVAPDRVAAIPLSAGLHHVDVSAPGFDPERFDVTIAPGASEERTITLGDQTGSIVVSSTPAGAVVLLGGQEVGRTPAVLQRLAFATHRLVVRLEGYRDVTQDVTLTREAPTSQVTASLEAIAGTRPPDRNVNPGGTESGELGTLIISTTPIARVLVDGVDTGRTTPIVPNNPLRLRPGAHRVTFRLPTGQTFDYSATIRAGEQARLVGIRLGD